ncbi:aspartate aminotransferase family protein [Pseudomonas soli]|jgi:diaminobutyrate-2-oxoglutarate transaminase|uniref:Aspartate aminotransferase family protein n=1 Tax=Pseudomonas soli TaxID=1306993 RepID=A0A1H9EYY8_9PSED|nr:MULTISPECIES: aspartate aminotransferase family protein [Pseudomonas]AUY32957.1 aspartate aminotransferase family protein [Pseudomonas sp. PONIH3]MCX5510340.1 aspartate aminotransferase family protein [Pseudomonas sp. BJa3]MDT3713079.1 aspartate aminotransferase family protein [Pseudomonas soli]MDT3730415.1 aspartate aminotransferase family protein [Pseudomonas soli]MDW9406036.1 aminotransferase class III-fold pyridoxal phosphate-dependent enzyme [Pseudomonas soli]
MSTASSLAQVLPATAPRPLYEFEDSPLLLRQQQQESNARSYPRRIPLALKRARGLYVEDVEGRQFIDCLAGAGTLALGHNHPVVIDAIQRVLADELPLHTLDLTTPVKDQFVQDLFGLLPEGLRGEAKIQFCGPTGTDAVEAALKLVRTVTGRSTVLAFQGAYHGMTQGALSLMGSLGPKKPLGALLNNGVQFLPYPYDYRCPFGLGGEAGVRANLHYLENLLNDPEAGVALPAAVIVEVVQGEGGVIPADIEWLRGLRRITEQAGVALIVDEIQSGFARTGKMFAFEHAGIVPDVVTLSKAIGGSLPLAVMVYRDWLDQWSPGAHAGTFRGNQMAMAAGSAVMKYLVEHRLCEHAEAMGQRLRGHLQRLQQDYPQLGDIRGRGLMLGVELVDPAGKRDAQGHPPACRSLAPKLQRECLRRGLILELGGRHGAVVRFLPPLIISAEQIDEVAARFAEAVAAAVKAG